MRQYITLGLLMFSLSGFSAVYRWVDANGIVNFSNEPNPSATKVDLSTAPFSTMPVETLPVSNPSANSVTKPANAEALNEAELLITSPKDQQTFQNQSTIDVQFTLNREVSAGGSIALYLDGKLVNSLTQGNNFTLLNVVRGSHRLQIKLLDANGMVLVESASITIYVHLPSVHLLRNSGQ